jgi:membrane-associated phospholipid phosphatase
MAFPGFAPLFGGAPQFFTPMVVVSQVSQPYAPMAAVTVSETAGPRDPFIFDPGYLESYPANAARVVAAPLLFGRQGWIDTAVVVGVGGGLMLLDSSIRDFVQGDLRGGVTDDLADAVYHFGSFYSLAAGLGATYMGGELVGDRRLQETGLLGGQALLLAGVLGVGVKWVTQRDRPNRGKGANSWSPFSFEHDNTSFPAGHAINAFAVASVVASEYGDTELVGPIAYGLATATSLSRINKDRHRASDVFIGGALGYFIGKMVVNHTPFDLPPGVAVGPWRQDDGQDLSLGFDF